MYQDDFFVRNYYTFTRQFNYFGQITFCTVLISVTSRPHANIRDGKRMTTQVKGRTEKQKT